MSIKFFNGDPDAVVHPRIRAWTARLARLPDARLRIEILREREPFGYAPPKLFVEFLRPGEETDERPDECAWEILLDTWLLKHGARAISGANEQLRFSLRLASALHPVLRRVGDGYFNSVFMDIVRESMGDRPELRPYKDIRMDRANQSPSLMQTKAEIEQLLAVLAREIHHDLAYKPVSAAETILAGAVAQYIDERFHISERKRLGL